ncbi:MAG: extracellular solute-binding protein [Candidatus Latescibacterota bacterium]|nr:MAG: extracellular solute-binding protein [Candidatus Latescibacterota bacterium]
MTDAKRTVVIALAVSVVLGFYGCGTKNETDRPLRFWQFWDTGVIEPIVREFETRNPGVTVEVEQLTWKSGLEKIQAAIASGTQPDLCELGSTWVPRFSYEGVLEDLTSIYTEVADSFIMWDSARWNGRVYGLPWVQGSRALFYNEDLFRRAGLDPDRPPKTWDELLVAAREIDGLSDDISGFGLNLGERYVLYKKFMAFARGNGGGIIDSNGQVVFDSPQNLEALEFYQTLARYSLKEKQEVLDHYFKSGRLGIQISGAWNLRNYALEAPDLNYRVALVPKPSATDGEHASFAGSEMLVIFKKSKRKGDALKLARFLHEYAQAKELCLAVRSVFPASKEALNDPEFSSDERVSVFVEQSMTSQTAPAHPGWIEIEDIINRAIEEVLYGRVEPREALGTAAVAIREVVERFE